MSGLSTLDCIIVGYNDTDFGQQLKAQKLGEKYSGGYRSSKANSLIYHGERITYTQLLNQVIAQATGVNSDLNVFNLPNLAVCYLKSFLSRRGLNVEIVNFFNSEKERFAEFLKQSPNAVALTTTFYTDDEPIIELVDFIRQHCPETKIIVGGPHIFNLQTRAFIAGSGDYYVGPLAGKQMPAEAVEKLLSPIFGGAQRLEQVYHPETETPEQPRLIAEGYEVRVELEAEVDGQPVQWQERRLVVRSVAHAARQAENLKPSPKSQQNATGLWKMYVY